MESRGGRDYSEGATRPWNENAERDVQRRSHARTLSRLLKNHRCAAQWKRAHRRTAAYRLPHHCRSRACLRRRSAWMTSGSPSGCQHARRTHPKSLPWRRLHSGTLSGRRSAWSPWGRRCCPRRRGRTELHARRWAGSVGVRAEEAHALPACTCTLHGARAQ
jgi:hypothetical protein